MDRVSEQENPQQDPALVADDVEQVEAEAAPPVASPEPAAVDEPSRAPAQQFDVTTQREEALAAAVAAVRAGECIVLPTDTVYGIGANAMDAKAVQALLDAKKRGRDMPPPVLIADPASLASLVQFVDEDAKALADRFWPGALTLILRVQEGLPMNLGETRGTIAIRVPDHDFTRDLLRRTGPLAVSSANISGQPSSTDIADARAQLGDSVAVYLDAGPTPGQTASTIVDFTVSTLGTVLRSGVITLEELHEVAKFVELEEPSAPAEESPAEESPAQEPPAEDQTEDQTSALADTLMEESTDDPDQHGTRTPPDA